MSSMKESASSAALGVKPIAVAYANGFKLQLKVYNVSIGSLFRLGKLKFAGLSKTEAGVVFPL